MILGRLTGSNPRIYSYGGHKSTSRGYSGNGNREIIPYSFHPEMFYMGNDDSRILLQHIDLYER